MQEPQRQATNGESPAEDPQDAVQQTAGEGDDLEVAAAAEPSADDTETTTVSPAASSADPKEAAPEEADPEEADTEEEIEEEEESGPLAKLPSVFSRAFLAQGFTELTEIQEAVLDAEVEDCDLRISSQTGSGKTVALGLVVAPHLLVADADRSASARPRGRKRPAAPKVLLVAPTRELAAQLGRELAWLFAGLGLRVAVVTGGTSIGGDFRILADQPELLIGTPGRLVDHLERGSLDLLDVEAVVLDEADEMLDMGFREELEKLLGATPNERRTHMVSATFPPKVLELADRYQQEAVLVEGKVGAQHADIEHVAILVQPQDRLKALVNLLLQHPDERVLVFVRTRVTASGLAGELSQYGFAVGSLSGEMAQRERTRWLGEFRARRLQCLVATDVAARGLDIRGVQRIVHFDLPTNREAFTHRSGRTGRAGESGENVLLVAPRARRRVEQQMRSVGVDIAWRTPPTAAQIRQAARQRLMERFGDGGDDDQGGTAAAAGGAVGQAGSDPSAGGGNDSQRFGDLRPIAEALLEQRSAVDLVADLLASVGGDGACEPFDLNVPQGHHGPRSGASGGAPPGRRDRAGNFTPFHLTWGSRSGATPKRLLAHVCRRGGIDGSAVGAIQIREFQSVVDIASAKAEDFEKAVRAPDPRNPRVRISRFVERGARSESPHHRHGGGHRAEPKQGRSAAGRGAQTSARRTVAPQQREPERHDDDRGALHGGAQPRKRGSSKSPTKSAKKSAKKTLDQAVGASGKGKAKKNGKKAVKRPAKGAKKVTKKGSKPPWAR